MSLFNFIACCFPSRPLNDEHAVLIDMREYYKWQENQNVFLLDMPDVVTNEILKNLDFVSIRKLRRVCHLFRDFIDCEKPDSNLTSLSLHVEADMIFGLTTLPLTPSQSTKSIEHSYKKQELISIMQQGPWYAIFRKNCVDLCVDDFLWPALKHQKSLMNELCVTKNWELDKYGDRVPQNPKRLVGPKYDKVFDGLVKILESRDRLLQVESLIVSVHGQDQLMQLLRHVDLKVLKSLEVRRQLETEQFLFNRESISEVVLDLDILKNCKNLESLHVRRFSISSPFCMFAHIPDLKVIMQTIYCEDLLLFKQTMENSDINAYSQILFEQFPDKSRFLEAIGLAENGKKSVRVFPSKLILTYDPAWRYMYFGWK